MGRILCPKQLSNNWIRGIIQHPPFGVWLSLLTITSSSLMPVAAHVRLSESPSFLRLNLLYGYATFYSSIVHSLVDARVVSALGCCEQCHCEHGAQMPSCPNPCFQRCSVNTQKETCWIQWQFCVSFLRSCRAVFRSGCTVSRAQQQSTRAPTSPHPHRHWLLSGFGIITLLVGVRCLLLPLIL